VLKVVVGSSVRTIVCGLLLAVGVSGCDESLQNVAGPTPNLQVSFASIQSEVFGTTDSAGRTACIVCHSVRNGVPPEAFLNLSAGVAYENLVNRPARFKPGAILIVPGDPQNSYLYQKITGAAGINGQRMPFNGPPYLTDGQISIIARWIERGANND